MNKLCEFVVKHGELNLNSMIDLLEQLDVDTAERFVMGVFGLEDYRFPEDAPKEIIHDGIVKTFSNYNYLNNRVECTYEKPVHRWYPDAESAMKWGWDYKSSKCEGYEYESVRTELRHDSFSLQSWINYANNKK